MSNLSNEDKKQLLAEVKEAYSIWKKDVESGRVKFTQSLEAAFKKEIESLDYSLYRL